MRLKRTKAQEAVVTNRGGTLLVSAAAGSGKTSVLVDRLLDRVIREGRNVNEFLIITFTKAAAEELRTRILSALSVKLKEEPEDSHLRKQMMLVYKTQISTIHSLCTTILREWGHSIDLPVDFLLCEDEDASILKMQALDNVLENRYEEIETDENFKKLLDILSAGKDDKRLVDIVLDIHNRIQSHPDPIRWMEKQKETFALEGVSTIDDTIWGQILLSDTEALVSYWLREFSSVMTEVQEDESLASYMDSLMVTYGDLQKLHEAVSFGWDAIKEMCQIAFPRLKPVRKANNPSLQSRAKQMRINCKEAISEIQSRFENSSEGLFADMELIYPAMAGLIDLIQEFDAAYYVLKTKKSMLDFSDLEHKTVALLYGSNGAYSELAKQIGSRFLEIMVDEYQDTNQVQNAIFSALSNGENNLFLVGDVKQSIYRFRLADPTIFLERYRTFLPYEEAGEGEGRKILLSQNFRSRPTVLSAVNEVFQNLMSVRLVEMNYTEAEALYPGGAFPEGEGYETELHILDFKAQLADEGGRAGNHELEAKFVAKRIAELLETPFQVSDGAGRLRSITQDDIVILLRAPSTVRHFYVNALRRYSISSVADDGDDFFESTEVVTMLSFLQIIDNPQQDIPLLSVLHSPLFGFSGEKLAEIRLAAKEGNLYTALKTAGDMGVEGCSEFLSLLENLRFESREMSCHELIWKLYGDCNAIEIFRRMPGGAQRAENLLDFYDLACRYEKNGHKGLFDFLFHLSKLEKSGSARPKGGVREQSGVKIISIHRSKGLEYPVVFLSGLGKRFNKSDMQKPVLFHPKLGLGPRGVDVDRMIEFPTLPRQAVALQLKREMLSEEMRLLYVAMTRAKEKLIMTCALSYGASEIRKIATNVTLPLDPNILQNASSVGQWMLLIAMARPEGSVLREIGGLEVRGSQGSSPNPWIIQYHEELPKEEPSSLQPGKKRELQEALFSSEELWSLLRWEYPYKKLSAIPAKLTATQINEKAKKEKESVYGKQIDEPRQKTATFRRPRFMTEEFGLTATQKGTAIHTVMQNIQLDKTASIEEIQEEVMRLIQQAYITPKEAASLCLEQVFGFFSSDLGKTMKRSHNIQREFPFSILVPASQYYGEVPSEETILVQGVIDVWFEEAGGITLVDFKSDRITLQETEKRAKSYEDQIAVYARALQEIIGKPVARRLIWFFAVNKAVELDAMRGEEAL